MSQPYRYDPPIYDPVQTRSYQVSPDSHAPTLPMAVGPIEPQIADGEHTLVSLPGIQVTNQFVHTPSGSIPLGQARWSIQNATTSTQGTPTWAIILAVVGFFVVTIFSLFFLLAKETKVSGVLIVSVSGPGVSYAQQIPVESPQEFSELMSRYEYARAVR